MSTYKTKWGRSAAVIMAAALVFTGLPGTEAQAAKKAKLSTKKLTVVVGKKKTIKIKNKAKKAKYTFKSKKASIAKVSKKGVVTGKRKGSTKITVTEKKGKKKRTLGKVTVKVTPVKTPENKNTPVPSTAPSVAPSTNPTQPTNTPGGSGQATETPKESAQPSDNPATPPVNATKSPTPPPTEKPTPDDPGTVTPKPETPITETPITETPITESGSGEKPDVALTVANSYAAGPLFDADGKDLGKGIENSDGSITFYTSAKYSGGGLNFYLNPDKSHFDYTKYSKIRITLSGKETEPDALGLYLGLICDGKKTPPWDSNADPVQVAIDGKPNAYPSMKGGGAEDVFEMDLSDITIPDDTDLGADCGIIALRIKYNGHEKDEAVKSTVTIKSIELIKK